MNDAPKSAEPLPGSSARDRAARYWDRHKGIIGYCILAVGVVLALAGIAYNTAQDNERQHDNLQRLAAASLSSAEYAVRAACGHDNTNRKGTAEAIIGLIDDSIDRSQRMLDADRESLTPAQLTAREQNLAQAKAFAEVTRERFSKDLGQVDCEAEVAAVGKTFRNTNR